MRAKQWMTGSVAALVLAAIIVSCGGTGGGGGSKGDTGQQFILNSNNSGRLSLNVNPGEVDANKSDRIGLVAVLSDSRGTGVSGVPITFSTDLNDITFIPASGTAVTNASGRADIIAVAGVSPTATGAIVGTGAIFAEPSSAFGLRAQVPITLFDVGFIDTVDGLLGVIPAGLDLVEPFPGQVVFFNIVGGTPPYLLKNEVSGIGAAVISQHCLPGCTENGGVLCIGSPCHDDTDCNLNGSPSPAGVCVGPIKRCLASCQGTNCGGSRCEIDADCNDGSPTPANVCKDSGQSIAYIISANPPTGTHGFVVEDSIADSVEVTVSVSFVCGNGTARGGEQCDLGDFRGATCANLGRPAGLLVCKPDCTFDVSGCTGAGATPGPGSTFTPGGGVATPTPTITPGAGSTPGGISNLVIAVGAPLSNVGADNNNNTATTVIAATASDGNGNPVEDGTVVSFGLTGNTFGAVITAQSSTGVLPPFCDIANYEQRTGVKVLQQHGVAHACITYPIQSPRPTVTVQASSGSVTAVPQMFQLPVALVNPNPEPTPP